MREFSRYFLQGIILLLAAASASAEVVYCEGSTSVVTQLTGDYDFVHKKPTLSQTRSRYGIHGTDLGSSFVHNGRLYFLFGDTPDIPNQEYKDIDCLAWTDTKSSADVNLTFLTDGPRLLPIRIPGLSQGTMEVPSCGISANEAMYIVHSTQWYGERGNMERSVLAKSEDNGYTWRRVYDLSAADNHDMSSARFINAGMTLVNAEEYEGKLPFSAATVILIWGSGAYRKSNPSLACVPADQIENKSALRYFCGVDSNNLPQWTDAESKAEDLFNHPRLGEFSVKWVPQVKSWVMLYNSRNPSGVCMRTAREPWGPYSEFTVILDKDFFQKQGWKAAYGPFIVEQFTSGTSENCSIYFTVSSWEPYATYLMCSRLKTN